MNFIVKYIRGREHKWVWFVQTLIGGGSLPIIISSFLTLSEEDLKWGNAYTVADVTFLGLSMNIANFSLVGNKEFKEKEICVLISYFLMLLLAVCLGFAYAKPALSGAFNIGVHALAVLSIFFSSSTNNYVVEHVRPTNP